MRKITIEAQ